LLVVATVVGVQASAGNRDRSAHRTAYSLPPSAANGRIVAQDQQGNLVLAAPSGSGPVVLAGLGSSGGEVVTAALDGQYLATLQGAVLAVNAPHGLEPTVDPALAGAALLGGPDTFADGDHALILVRSSPLQLHAGTVFAYTFASQKSATFGLADEAAGDPQAVGVFVSVASTGRADHAPPGGYLGLADSRVELRDAGQSPLVVATAAELNRDVGQNPEQPVHLSLFPTPSGDAVAVEVNPPTGGDADVGVVVLTRSGQLIGVIKTRSGPLEYSWPAWSPDGRSLAYSTVTDSGTALAIWTEGGPIVVRAAPDNGASFGYCLWAPDGSAILCPTFQSARDSWDQGAAHGGPLFSVPGAGTPIVWLPAAARR
jgi:hypothetical protein